MNEQKLVRSEEKPRYRVPANTGEAPSMPLISLPEKQTDALLVMIQGATQNPDIDTGVIEKLWEMQKESQDRDAKAAFAKAKARAQKNMPSSISANQENTHTRSKYSDLTAVNTQVVPVYSAEGFSLSFNTGKSEIENCITIKAELMHEEGHSEEFEFDLPIDDVGTAGAKTKTGIHGRASTVSYGQRYLVCMIWNVATGDDNDGNVRQQNKQVEYITAAQVADISAMLDEKKNGAARFLKHNRIESLSEITKDNFSKAISAVEKMQ